MKTNLTKTGYCLLAALLLSVSYSSNANATNGSNPGKVIAVKPPYVSLTFFRASITANSWARIDWGTMKEQNSDYFIIQKSTNGKTFTTVGEVKSSGDSNDPVSYYFIDENAVNAVTYYTIIEVDKDGKTMDLGTEMVKPKMRR